MNTVSSVEDALAGSSFQLCSLLKALGYLLYCCPPVTEVGSSLVRTRDFEDSWNHHVRGWDKGALFISESTFNKTKEHMMSDYSILDQRTRYMHTLCSSQWMVGEKQPDSGREGGVSDFLLLDLPIQDSSNPSIMPWPGDPTLSTWTIGDYFGSKL